ncbi:ABC transporter substrate-binding protein [Candidatus Gottesmanbacteria bacterium]|nr:ABC transporter substrate-binding protein [Candidatus Gottesmanbacteria bacterium]
MMLRKGRFIYWLVSELVQKYKGALIFGFLIGLIIPIALNHFSKNLQWLPVEKIERIGLVGDYTPSALPASIQQKISIGLTSVDESGYPIPALATSWESTDAGKLYTFHLANNLLWHDGKRVVAQDINYNIKQVTFTATNDTTLEVRLTTAHSPFPVLLAKPIFRPGLLGFGPYKVIGIRLLGDRVQYLKLSPVKTNTGPVYEYRFYRTEALALTAYKLGEIDVLEDVSDKQAVLDFGAPHLAEKVNYHRMIVLFFNTRESILKEKNIRQALAYGIPAMAEDRAYSPISKRSWAYTDKIKTYIPDNDRAKKLLTQAGIASQSASLTITTFIPYLPLAQSIANNWTALGVPTTVRVENFTPQSYQVLLASMDVPPDPDQYPFWHSTQITTNVSGYVNVKIDKLLEDGRQEMDRDKRRSLYTDFQRRLVDDVPAVFLYYPKTYTVKRR